MLCVQQIPDSKLKALMLGALITVVCLTSVHAEQRLPRHVTPFKSLAPSLDGTGNNSSNPNQGAVNTVYRRVAAAHYLDGLSAMVEGPNARYISNRIFEDSAQNLFSETGVTQWAYNWGQFVDHTIGLRDSGPEAMNVTFDVNDALEQFANDGDILHATRTAAMPGTGESSQREQINTVSSYIDGWAIYGGSDERLEWIREGPVDSDMSNNGAKLLMTDSGFLPRANERGDTEAAPAMERGGRLMFAPDADEQVIIAGDMRANENIALTTVQTLFAREHNRIVDKLPEDWSEQKKFDTARQLVVATQQYITYEEFLPALGVHLAPATGYKRNVDASVTNEFATVGFRAHSMIHGEIEVAVEADEYDDGQLALFLAMGIEVEQSDQAVELAIPLNVAFHNPQLVTSLGLEPLLSGLGGEPQYRNDEQIDNQLRSVMFQIPVREGSNAHSCLDGPTLNECFSLVADLGLLDIMRGRDHGMPYYNDLREAYGLTRFNSFSTLTGEQSEAFPESDPLVDTTDPLNDPDILDFVELRDAEGQLLELGSDAAGAEAVVGIRRTTLAARLKALYGDINKVDAFVGMVSEPHLIGSDLGELQHAIWKQQFEALRDGDRYFYAWNKSLKKSKRVLPLLNLNWRKTLADVVADNSDLMLEDIQANLFLTRDAQ
jgi:hypothetical protein